MYFNRIIFAVCVLCSVKTFAENPPASGHGGGSPPPAEHGSAPATGGATGGSPGAAAGEAESDKMPGWVSIQNELSMISAKTNAVKGNIRKLLEEKRELPENSHKLKELIDELVKQHRDLKKLSVEYEQQRSILRYRYPERAVRSGFQEKIEVKSLEEMESELNLDERLNRNLNKVRSQYQSKPKRTDSKKHTKPIEDSDSIILRK